MRALLALTAAAAWAGVVTGDQGDMEHKGGFLKAVFTLNPEYLASIGQGASNNGNGNGNAFGQDGGDNGRGLLEGGDGAGVRGGNGRQLALVQAGIQYHNGPVGPVAGTALNVYVIWYGNWTSSNTAMVVVEKLLANIGASSWYKIQTTYTNAAGTNLSTVVRFIASTYVGSGSVPVQAYSKSLTDTNIRTIVLNALPTFHPKTRQADPNGIYFVLTSSDVTASSGFCTQYCGWHTYYSTSGGFNASSMKYSFVGDPSRCPSACSAIGSSTSSPSPNGSFSADSMISIIAHELAEAHSDPNLNAWYDRSGNENADKCAWTFGTISHTSTNAPYNEDINGTKYLIQRNWLNRGTGSCSMGIN